MKVEIKNNIMIIEKIIGYFIIMNIAPCIVWLLWDDNYEPRKGIDAFINSFHPFIAGWIVNIILFTIIGIIAVVVTLINHTNKTIK